MKNCPLYLSVEMVLKKSRVKLLLDPVKLGCCNERKLQFSHASLFIIFKAACLDLLSFKLKNKNKIIIKNKTMIIITIIN